jgi:hypothetical protein
MNNGSEKKPDFKSQIPGILIALATAGATFWLVIYEYWPVPELNYIQASIFLDYYSPEVTFFITWLILLSPFVLIKLILKKRKQKSS